MYPFIHPEAMDIRVCHNLNDTMKRSSRKPKHLNTNLVNVSFPMRQLFLYVNFFPFSVKRKFSLNKEDTSSII